MIFQRCISAPCFCASMISVRSDLASVGTKVLGLGAVGGVAPVGADRAVRTDFALAARLGHGDDGGILVDIEAHVLNVRFHVLVFLSWWFGERLHHAAPVAFRD
jgi:hypothetical protein